MPPKCSICTHPDRAEIDSALVESESLRTIADRYKVSKTSLIRHKTDHMTELMVQASQAVALSADDLLGQVHMLQESTIRILKTAEADGHNRVALTAVREARGNLELLGKLTNQLNDRPVTNVLIAPEWLTVRAILFEALRDYPDARAAVADRLKALGG